jgi:hypothetical protein
MIIPLNLIRKGKYIICKIIKKRGGRKNKIQCGKREMYTHIKKKKKKKKERVMKIDFARESKAYIEKEFV